MELPEKNGHASIEEILASVRRIIAEEPGTHSPLIDLRTAPSQPQRGDGLLEDPSDFDLPSMFKTPSAAPAGDKPAPLFGRLSEAIRAASNGSAAPADPSRTDHSLSTLKLNRPESGDGLAASHFLLSTFHEASTPKVEEIAAAASPEPAPAASSLNGASYVNGAPAPVMSVSSEPVRPSFEPGAADKPGESHGPGAPQMPRRMAAFKDTRFQAMGVAPVVPELATPSSPFEDAATANLVSAAAHSFEPLKPAAADEPALMQPLDAMPSGETAAGLTAAIVASYPALSPVPSYEQPSIQPAAPVPPPVPAAAQSAAAPGEAPAPIEDSTADLLRPMLRQWLAENMPRMVEKALHIEVAESVKSKK